MAPSADDGFDDAELPTSRGAPRKAFLLRIPPALHDELRRWASREMRSLNAQVEYLLREAVRKKRGED
jgi:hypothetical protein